MLKVYDLAIGYATVKLVEGLSFECKPGEILGVIGKNGIGKTTLLKTLLSLKKPHAGKVEIDLDKVGYLPENTEAYEYMTGKELLRIITHLKGIACGSVEKLLEELSAYISFPDLNQLISEYSKGNREKLLFILALAGTPDLLVLDEPFTGFDPKSYAGAKRYLQEFVRKGNAVLMSSHNIEMTAQLCSRVIILRGRTDFETIDFNGQDKLEDKLHTLEEVVGEL